MPVEILGRRERAGVHPVQVQRAMQMVDLMLQDAGIPAFGRERPRLAALIQALDASPRRARDQAEEAGDTEAAFEELHRLAFQRERWIDDDVKRQGTAAALGEFLR